LGDTILADLIKLIPKPVDLLGFESWFGFENPDLFGR